VGLDLAPDGGGLEAARQNDDAREEGHQAGAASWFPPVQVGPVGQLADGYEGGRELLSDESAEGCRAAAP
jgi:hypothetical protein